MNVTSSYAYHTVYLDQIKRSEQHNKWISDYINFIISESSSASYSPLTTSTCYSVPWYSACPSLAPTTTIRWERERYRYLQIVLLLWNDSVWYMYRELPCSFKEQNASELKTYLIFKFEFYSIHFLRILVKDDEM